MLVKSHVESNANNLVQIPQQTFFTCQFEIKYYSKSLVPPHERCCSIPLTVGRGDNILTTLDTAHKMGITRALP